MHRRRAAAQSRQGVAGRLRRAEIARRAEGVGVGPCARPNPPCSAWLPFGSRSNQAPLRDRHQCEIPSRQEPRNLGQDASPAATATTDGWSESRRNAITQAARRTRGKPSISLIRGALIIVITLRMTRVMWRRSYARRKRSRRKIRCAADAGWARPGCFLGKRLRGWMSECPRGWMSESPRLGLWMDAESVDGQTEGKSNWVDLDRWFKRFALRSGRFAPCVAGPRDDRPIQVRAASRSPSATLAGRRAALAGRNDAALPVRGRHRPG
jgi:hypothetical protein